MILIDAYARIYRGYHALPPMSDASGRPTSALFSFAKFLLALERDFHPEYGAVVYDLGEPEARTRLLPSYKANRPPMPDELREQLEAIRRVVEAFGYPALEIEGKEADDVIAALAASFEDFDVKVISSDKDLAQIINDRVVMLVPDRKGGGLSVRGKAEVKEKFGVTPEQVVDYLALIGDSSDNIPGVRGVGAKTAAALLAEFGSVDGILANLDSVKRERTRAALKESAEILRRNVELVKLDCGLPDDNWRSESLIRRSTPDWNALTEIAREYDLHSLRKEFEKIASSTPPPGNSSVAETDGRAAEDGEIGESEGAPGGMFTPDFFDEAGDGAPGGRE